MLLHMFLKVTNLKTYWRFWEAKDNLNDVHEDRVLTMHIWNDVPVDIFFTMYMLACICVHLNTIKAVHVWLSTTSTILIHFIVISRLLSKITRTQELVYMDNTSISVSIHTPLSTLSRTYGYIVMYSLSHLQCPLIFSNFLFHQN